VGNPLGGQLLPEERQERRELGEDEQAVPVIGGLLKDLTERLELGRAVVRLRSCRGLC